MHKSTRIFYWLAPDSSSSYELDFIIKFLANKYNGITFLPHITLYVSNLDSSDDLKLICSEFSKLNSEAINSNFKLEFSKSFVKSCYIQFDQNDQLNLLYSFINEKVKEKSDYNFNPHLSLFYGKLSEQQKETLIHEINLPKSIKFTDLVVVAGPEENKSYEDIESWEEIIRIPLKQEILITNLTPASY